MKELMSAVKSHVEQGERVVLCTILASSGSTPRGAGARMAVFADGSSRGTIGGGAVEHAARQQALAVLQSGAPRLEGYCLAPNEKTDLGMVCGGDVTVYFQCLTAADVPMLQAVLEALSGGEDAWLVLQLRENLVADTGVVRGDAVIFGSVPEGQQLLQPDTVLLRQGETLWYAEPIRRAGMVYIFGAGHVSQALAPVLRTVDFPVTVYDPRCQLLSRERFPTAEALLCRDFTEMSRCLTVTDRDYVVIMTPGHEADREVLLWALSTPARYIGCIGSSRKIRATRAWLEERGVPREAWGRVCAPIGLPIGGSTPAEIAISVTAQLIACRSGKL